MRRDRPLRIALYCHNTLGLGHIMRSALIADALRARDEGAELCMTTGCRMLDRIRLPATVTIERLEPITPADLARGVPPQSARRSRAIAAFVRDWRPDVLLVDLLPEGLNGELLAALEHCERERAPTRFVLGIPYPADKSLRRPCWGAQKLAIDHYRTVIAYGDPDFAPVLNPYRDMIRDADQLYAGIVTQPPPPLPEPVADDLPPLLVILNGGGGTRGLFGAIARPVAGLLAAGTLRARVVGGVLGSWTDSDLGPLAGQVEFVGAMTVEEAVQGARIVVSRAGYNSAFALAQMPVPVVFVPQQQSHGEQADRARALARLDGIWCVEPGIDEAATERTLSAALAAALSAPFRAREVPFACDGAARTADLLLGLARRVRD